MRWVEGRDLSYLLHYERQLAPDRAVRIISQIAAALDAAHARGLVHRDVKPANVLVGGRGPRLPDRLRALAGTPSASRMTKTGLFVGSVDYAAPEQVRGEATSARTDVYALGAMLYQVLTGAVPFDRPTDVAKMYAHITEPPPVVTALRPDVPAAFDAIVAQGDGQGGRGALRVRRRAGPRGPAVCARRRRQSWAAPPLGAGLATVAGSLPAVRPRPRRLRRPRRSRRPPAPVPAPPSAPTPAPAPAAPAPNLHISAAVPAGSAPSWAAAPADGTLTRRRGDAGGRGDSNWGSRRARRPSPPTLRARHRAADRARGRHRRRGPTAARRRGRGRAAAADRRRRGDRHRHRDRRGPARPRRRDDRGRRRPRRRRRQRRPRVRRQPARRDALRPRPADQRARRGADPRRLRGRTASWPARASCGSAPPARTPSSASNPRASPSARPTSTSATAPRRSRSASSSCGSRTSTTAPSTASTAPRRRSSAARSASAASPPGSSSAAASCG